MRYSRVGRSGLEVSQLCLGTFMYGGRASREDALRMVARARDAGINFIDTADQYGKGLSEEIVGEAVRGERDHWVLATKVGNPMDAGRNSRGLTRRWIHLGVENSLRRLGTDWIDVLYMHNEDPAVPLEETVGAIGDLVRAGKIRYFGVSNHSGWKVATIAMLCRQMGIDPPLFSQPHYNLADRTAEADHIPACRAHGIGVVPYSPLARGVLTGKYAPGDAPALGTRAGIADRRMMEVEWHEETLAVAQAVRERAEARGMTATAFAVLWLLDNAAVASTVIGARTPGQLEGYLAAMAHTLDADDEAFVDSLVVPGRMASAAFVDPQYPVRGRYPRALTR